MSVSRTVFSSEKGALLRPVLFRVHFPEPAGAFRPSVSLAEHFQHDLLAVNDCAAVHDIDDETLRQLQSMCVNEVRRINGIISYEDAVEFQKE